MYLALLGACIGSITPKGWEKQAYKDAKGVREMDKSLLNAMKIISCELGVIIGLLLSIGIRL